MQSDNGRLLENIMHFARVLRTAGLPIGPGRVIDAISAVEKTGIRRRDDFYWTLHGVFVSRYEHKTLFDQAFHMFWRNPEILEKAMRLLLPTLRVESDEQKKTAPSRRVTDALLPGSPEMTPDAQEQEQVEVDATMTFSDSEVLQSMDFESMSAEEVEEAKAALSRMRIPIKAFPTRRFRPDSRGTRVDMRATMRSALRTGGGIIHIRRRSRQRRHPPLVILCDISGSMARYSRMFMHFLHAITNDRDRVHTFLFGTRLTNITRYLRNHDIDVALAKVGDVVEDWSGGTRIGHCLKEFNTTWSRRVLGQGAVVMLITDGLDRDAGEGLEREIERLHKSCRRLIWLNPLLRYEGFEPKSKGIQAILPHVDDFRPVHNLKSLKDLAEALRHAGPRSEKGASRRSEAA